MSVGRAGVAARGVPTFFPALRRRARVTVKSRVGRTRYVAFRVDGGPVSRGALATALPPVARLTRFDGTFGLARCLHRDLEAVRRVLNGPARVGGADVHLASLATSGTIRAAARALPPESAASKRAPRKID
jgi:RNase P/RNase MRP subunit POP5